MARSNMNLLFKDKSACLRLNSPPALTSTSHCNWVRLVSALLITAGIIMLLAPGQNVETRERVNNSVPTESQQAVQCQGSVTTQHIIPVCLSAFSVYQVLCISHLKTWETYNNKIFSSFLFLNPLFMIPRQNHLSACGLWCINNVSIIYLLLKSVRLK